MRIQHLLLAMGLIILSASISQAAPIHGLFDRGDESKFNVALAFDLDHESDFDYDAGSDDADYTRFYVRGEYELTEMFAAFGEFGMGNIETGDYGLTFGLGVKASILELGTGMWLGAIGSFTMINSSEEESYGWEKIEVEGSWSIFQALGIFDYSAIENLHLYGAFGFVIEKISAEANGYDVDADGEDLIYIGGGASYNVTPEIQIFAELSLLADMGFTVGAKYLLNL